MVVKTRRLASDTRGADAFDRLPELLSADPDTQELLRSFIGSLVYAGSEDKTFLQLTDTPFGYATGFPNDPNAQLVVINQDYSGLTFMQQPQNVMRGIGCSVGGSESCTSGAGSTSLALSTSYYDAYGMFAMSGGTDRVVVLVPGWYALMSTFSGHHESTTGDNEWSIQIAVNVYDSTESFLYYQYLTIGSQVVSAISDETTRDGAMCYLLPGPMDVGSTVRFSYTYVSAGAEDLDLNSYVSLFKVGDP